jgi:hypothetical protein
VNECIILSSTDHQEKEASGEKATGWLGWPPEEEEGPYEGNQRLPNNNMVSRFMFTTETYYSSAPPAPVKGLFPARQQQGWMKTLVRTVR